MIILSNLIANNRKWSTDIRSRDPSFFEKLSQQQAPEYLWIGCADSRVPANDIVGLLPGELFVHRNVSNVVIHTDLNCLSVLQYAVEVLKVKHIIVCGHYGCGGVASAVNNEKLGLIDNWLRNVQDVQSKHRILLENVQDKHQLQDRMCELNVIEQALNVCETTITQDAWGRGQLLTVHGWIYSIKDGLIRDLKIGVSQANEISERYNYAVQLVHDSIKNQ